MSNDPFNTLRVVGPAGDLTRFKEMALEVGRRERGEAEVFGLPGASTYGSRLIEEGQDSILYGFYSSDAPPHYDVQAASEGFADLVFLLTYKEDGLAYRGRDVYQAGELLADCDGPYGAEGSAYYDERHPLPNVFAPYFNERKTRNLRANVDAFGGRCHVCGGRMLQYDHPDVGYVVEACTWCGYAAGEALDREGRGDWVALTPHQVWRVFLSASGVRHRHALIRKLNLNSGPGMNTDHFWPSVFRHDRALREAYDAALATPETPERRGAAASALRALEAFDEGRFGVAVTRAHEAAEADPAFAPLRERLMRLGPSPLHLLPRPLNARGVGLLYGRSPGGRLDRRFDFEVEETAGGLLAVHVIDHENGDARMQANAFPEGVKPAPRQFFVVPDERGCFLADVLESAGIMTARRGLVEHGESAYFDCLLLRRNTPLPSVLVTPDPAEAGAAQPEIEVLHNNAACLSTCGVCRSQFKPPVGDWPFLKGTWEPVCASCEAGVAAGLRLMEIMPSGPSALLEGLPCVPLAPVLHPHGLCKLQFVCSAESAALIRAAVAARPEDFAVERDEPANAFDLEAALSLNAQLSRMPHLFEEGLAPETLSPPYTYEGELLAYLRLPPAAVFETANSRGYDWSCLRCQNLLLYVDAQPCPDCCLCPGCCPCNELTGAAPAAPAGQDEGDGDGLPF